MGRGSGCLKWHSCGIDKGQDVCPPGERSGLKVSKPGLFSWFEDRPSALFPLL